MDELVPRGAEVKTLFSKLWKSTVHSLAPCRKHENNNSDEKANKQRKETESLSRV